MCSPVSTAVRAATDVATFGTAEIGGISSKLGDTVGRVAGEGGSGSYKPTLLPTENPYMQLAQTGGATLLTNVALGANIEDALASHFGRTSGQDWDTFQKSLSDDERSAIDGVRKQLTEVQSNTDLRNKAVQSVVNDFPNIAAKAAQSRVDETAKAGTDFDAATKQYIDLALGKNAAAYAANGGISSGAEVAAAARVGAGLGLQKLDYTTQRGDQGYETAYGSAMNEWNARYSETSALRNFQMKMLGVGADQGFSANQNALNRNQSTNQFNAGSTNQAKLYDQQSNDAMFGAIGGLAGTALGYTLGGPVGGMVGRSIGSGAVSAGAGSNSAPGVGPISTPRDTMAYRPRGY